ncbi:TIGR03618 family F420-dependent PPOX class oxidoreductase [Solirubrobacter ginsenosidimutans]|uniref:TIGR03618 family F420-dependent PPOX class oxidoreductase n=1 Tax=Solirubrobacter ginsenosidimutans TaxID=490573 RepID=A0A9X3N1N7_9ACTN|nr:TIGR03618 family F420-dependent PPOX class oxidoreductase [Solirubrobacter ginsenosidimutans]MDA0166735.1 TIGR03618 family F420-dependent PPOX class oxidoreductase [Solirubrobacter ginsenosidimutans]
MPPSVPPQLIPLLESTAIAFISTIGPTGAPQTTPQWFLWKDGALHFSLVEGRQKLRNLRRDPRLSVVVANPADPTWYVELRGHVDALVPDPELALERTIALKYAGSHVDVEPSGTARYAATVVVEKLTHQLGH